MDDIADILAATEPAIPQAQLDLQHLTRAWVSEKVAPELLPWPAGLMDRVGERIRVQIAKIEELTAAETPEHVFHLVVMQTELERWKFLVRSLVRVRIDKLRRWGLWYLTQNAGASSSASASASASTAAPTERSTSPSSSIMPSSSIPEPELESQSQPQGHSRHQGLLSPSETRFLQSHQTLLHTLYSSSFLAALPPHLRRLDDAVGGVPMIAGPDLDAAVFVRVVRDGSLGEQGDVVVRRWKEVKDLVLATTEPEGELV